MSAESPIKTIDDLSVNYVGNEVHIHVSAKSFLHHQVRNIAGNLALVGVEKWGIDEVKNAHAAIDQPRPTAPPWGLYLIGVEYTD